MLSILAVSALRVELQCRTRAPDPRVCPSRSDHSGGLDVLEFSKRRLPSVVPHSIGVDEWTALSVLSLCISTSSYKWEGCRANIMPPCLHLTLVLILQLDWEPFLAADLCLCRAIPFY